MIVLGIDPGYDRLGVALIRKEKGQRETVLFSDCVLTNKSDTFPVRLLAAGTAVEGLITKWSPTHMSLEKLFVTKNQKTAMAVSEVRGMLIYIATKHGMPLVEFTPQQVKLAVTGYGGATKKQLEEMLPRILTLPHTPKYDDEYDALGISLTGAVSIRE